MPCLKFDEISKSLCPRIHKSLLTIPYHVKISICEIRLKTNKPLLLYGSSSAYFVTESGSIVPCDNANINYNTLLITQKEDITESFNNICEYSVYTHQHEIQNGFITLPGGHRVGMCGTAVINNSNITTLKHISSLNIRVAREVIGCSDSILKLITNDMAGLLIVGPPSCGKTTLLRDIARSLSLNIHNKVAIIDERCEIAGTNNGTTQNNVGFCDVLNNYPKEIGITHAIRTLSPNIIICDEVGTTEDIEAIRYGLNAGVTIIASAHANEKTLLHRIQTKKLLDTGAFEKVILMNNRNHPGIISSIVNYMDLHHQSIN